MNRKLSGRNAMAKAEADVEVHNSSGNVFADLALPNPEEHMAKAKLAHLICGLIESAGLSQRDAAARLGVDQPKVSALFRGKLLDFSLERLMRFATALDQDVIITIRDAKNGRHPSVRVLTKA